MGGSGTAAIELNDVGVILDGPSGTGAPSPGIAVWDGGRLRVGEDAQRSWHLRPRQANDSFWDTLSQDALPRPLGFAASAADLAHAHLESVWSPASRTTESVVVALTVAFEFERLGLLLGIAQSLSIPVVGVADAAVVCAAGENAESVIHVDLQRYRAVITRVECGEVCVRGESAVVDGLGSRLFVDRLAATAAESFVRQTRFDPLHRAEDEQALHDRLPGCLAELRECDEVPFELEAGGRRHGVQLRQREFIQEIAPLAETLVSRARDLLKPGGTTVCQLSARVLELPGLAEAFRLGLDCDVVSLPEGFAAREARLRIAEIRSSERAVPYVTQLSRGSGREARPLSSAGVLYGA